MLGILDRNTCLIAIYGWSNKYSGSCQKKVGRPENPRNDWCGPIMVLLLYIRLSNSPEGSLKKVIGQEGTRVVSAQCQEIVITLLLHIQRFGKKGPILSWIIFDRWSSYPHPNVCKVCDQLISSTFLDTEFAFINQVLQIKVWSSWSSLECTYLLAHRICSFLKRFSVLKT